MQPDFFAYICSETLVNNCSDFACSGVAEALDRYKSWIEIFADERAAFGFVRYTTPNGLYKYVKDRIKSNPKEGEELRNPGSVIDNKFKDVIIAPAKRQIQNNTKRQKQNNIEQI